MWATSLLRSINTFATGLVERIMYLDTTRLIVLVLIVGKKISPSN